MNYSELQANVATYLHRTDLTAVIPTFIQLAEGYLFREISPPETEIVATGVTVSGYAVLPSDFGTLQRLTVTSGGVTRALEYIALANVGTEVAEAPGYYSFEAGKLRIYGTSDGQPYTLHYLPGMEPLSDSNTSNWLLANAPDLYLYASCLEGAKYIRDDQEGVKLQTLVTASIDSVRRVAERKGLPASGPLQIKVRNAV
jgi:hypothetical protein